MYEFFLHFLRHITSKNQMAFCDIKLQLRLFQALKIFFILQIKLNMQNKGILINKIKYKKIRYLVFKIYIINVTKRFNF